MPHEKKKRKGKESCKNSQRLFIQDNYYISNYIWWHLYAMQNQDYILVNIWSRLLGQRSNIGGLVEVQSGVKSVMKENHVM